MRRETVETLPFLLRLLFPGLTETLFIIQRTQVLHAVAD